MKMLKKMKYWMGALLLSTLVFTACDDEPSEAPDLTITALTATGTDVTTGEETTVDLNAATTATAVPPDAVFEITFDRDLDAGSVTNSSIELSDGETTVPVTVVATDNVITVTPNQELAQGTDYTVTVLATVEATDGGLVTNGSRLFGTAGRAPVDAPLAASQVAFWKFDGDASDEMGNYADGTEVAIVYDTDRFGLVSSTAYFDGDQSIIEIPNAASLLNNSDDLTLSFWLKTNTEGHVNENGDPTGMYVFGMGAFFGIQYEIFGSYEGSKFGASFINEEEVGLSEDMFFPSNATDASNGGWQGWDFARSLTPEQMSGIIKDTWYHVIYTYDAAEKKCALYFNGELMKTYDFDLWPEGDAKRTVTGVTYRGAEPEVFPEMAFGFVQSRQGSLWDNEPWGGYAIPTSQHFKGWLDDFRVIHAAYTAENAAALYEAERP